MQAAEKKPDGGNAERRTQALERGKDNRVEMVADATDGGGRNGGRQDVDGWRWWAFGRGNVPTGKERSEEENPVERNS